MDLIAKLPIVAATIYNNAFRGGKSIGTIDPDADWSKNFAHMMGYNDPLFTELMRLYLTIHCDHEVCLVLVKSLHNFQEIVKNDFLCKLGWKR